MCPRACHRYKFLELLYIAVTIAIWIDYKFHRKNFRIPILGLKREIIGISKGFFGKPKIGKVLPKPFMGQENPILIPTIGFLCSNFYPRMGFLCTIFSPALGLKIPILIPTVGFFCPNFYRRMGFLCTTFPQYWD